MFIENDDMILPDDFQMEEETAQPQAEQEEEIETTEEDTTQPQEVLPEENKEVIQTLEELEVKFLGQQKKLKELDKVELKNYIEKGMNYDRVQEKLNQLQNDPALTLIKDMARQYNMTPEEYVKAVQQSKEQQQIDELVDQGLSEEAAKEVIEARRIKAENRIKEESQKKEEETKKQIEERIRKENDEFLQAYPTVDVRKDIKQETWDLVEKGVPLKFAYMQQERNDLVQRMKILEQNYKNVSQSPVKGTTGHGTQSVTSKDPFEEGFDSINY